MNVITKILNYGNDTAEVYDCKKYSPVLFSGITLVVFLVIGNTEMFQSEKAPVGCDHTSFLIWSWFGSNATSNFRDVLVRITHCPFPCHSVLRMNHLSFSELCCLFCCPPCPSKIASKLAFLPPEPTYSLMCDDSGSRWTLHLSERADWQYSAREKDAVECFMTRTSRGNRIACMFVRCSPNARYTLLFSHGNAVDLGQMSSFYIGLGSRINCNVFSYDYSGYGASSGKPSEKNLYADVDAAWHALRSR